MVSRREYATVFSLRFVGYFMVLSALAGVFLTFQPVLASEVNFRLDQWQHKTYALEDDLNKPKAVPVKPDLNKFLPPLVGISPVNRDFSIVIPKINANSAVIANVDAGDREAYTKALKEGVAHAAGTVYPGKIGNSFLFAHSAGNFWEVSQYNAVFFLLKELKPGDEIDIFFNNKRYYYLVTDSKIVEPNDTQYMTMQTNFSQLTLQTCWPPGTAWKRLLVFARLQNPD